MDGFAKDLAERLKPLQEHPTFGHPEADALLRKQAEWRKRQEERARKGGENDADEDEVGGEVTPAARANLRLAKAVGPAAFAAMRSGERDVFAERPTPMQLEFSDAQVGILASYRQERALVDPHPIERVRLAVTCAEDGVTLILMGLDAKGNLVDGDALALDGGDEAQGDAKLASSAPEKPLELTQDAAEFRRITARGARRDDLFAKWKPRFADPVAYEPTGWFPGAALVAAAEAQGRNLIGSVSDLSWRMLRAKDAWTASSLFQAMHADVTLRDGWLVAKPTSLRRRVGRADARALFAKGIEQGGLDIDTAADWCARYPKGYPAISWVGDDLARLASRLSIGFDEDSLAFWGSLSDAARAALREGQALPVASLSAASREIVAERIYGTDDGTGFMENEPTELLPRGVLGGRVSMEVKESPVAVSWAEGDEPLVVKALSPELYGTRLAQQEKSGNVVVYTRFRLGLRRTYIFSYEFPSVETMATDTMTETFFDPKNAPVETLPADFLKRAEIARLKTLDPPDEP